MSKKLVQINVVCNGSTGRIMEQIQQKAIAEGYEAYSFYGRGRSSNNRCIKVGNKLDVLYHVFLTRIFDKHGYGSKRATKKMIKQIKKIDPDIIQLHNIHGYYLNIKILFDYLRTCNKKIVWTLHDCWAFTGHCSYFTMEGCNRWIDGCNNCPQKDKYPKSILIDNSKKGYILKKQLFCGLNNLTIVTPSKWLADLVKKSFLKDYHVEIINNGIDLDIFKPDETYVIRKKYNIDKNKKIILGVSAIWEERKGLKYFIEINKIKDNDMQLFLVGLNKKQILELPNNIIGIERTENTKELVQIYSTSDVFFNPSLEETFCLVVAESLACGTPAVVFDSAATPELIDNNVGKIVNDYNDIKNSLESIRTVLYKGKKFYKEKCIEKSKKYDRKYSYEKYMNLYKG